MRENPVISLISLISLTLYSENILIDFQGETFKIGIFADFL